MPSPPASPKSSKKLPLRRHRQTGLFTRYLAIVCGATAMTWVPAAAKTPEPAQRISLEPLGYQAISTRYLLNGATMLTVDYVDNQHLLVTFGVSKLMMRQPDCPPEDEDRTVKAVLLELPTGKELAHAEWRLHDLGQYVWNLGGGTFMLRQRDVLTTFSPLEQVAAGAAFQQHKFLNFERKIEAIVVSANRDLLTIETIKRHPPRADSLQLAGSVTQQAGTPAVRQTGLLRRDKEEAPDPAPVEITFIRLIRDSEGSASTHDAASNHITAVLDGKLHTSKTVSIPLTSEGFLQTKATTRDGVLLDFVTFSGKTIELGDFATSCAPKPTFVSPSEFVAFGCRGSDESTDLAGFNLRGDLLWQMNFSDIHAYPSIVAAVPSGRFALSRTTTLSHIFGSETPSAEQLTGQEVRVVQAYNGKVLLRVQTSPIQRAGQNFALSPDGLSLAAIHDTVEVHGLDSVHHTAVEIYRLPENSAKDEKEIKAEVALAPEPANARMRFSIDEIKAALTTKPEIEAPNDSKIVGDSNEQAAESKMPTATGSIPASDPASSCGAVGSEAGACENKPVAAARTTPEPQLEEEHRRKPPTLYEPAPPEDSKPPQ